MFLTRRYEPLPELNRTCRCSIKVNKKGFICWSSILCPKQSEQVYSCSLIPKVCFFLKNVQFFRKTAPLISLISTGQRSFCDFLDQSIFRSRFLKNNDFRADFWWALDTLVLLVMFLIDIIPCFFGKFFCSDVSRIAPMRFVLLQCREKSETSNLIPIP